MLRKRVEDRVGPVADLGKVSLSGHRLVFDTASSSGSGKANLVADASSNVWGVVYELNPKQIEALDAEEKKYSRFTTRGILNGSDVEFMIYLGKPEAKREGLKPTKKYLDYIVGGAIEHGLPSDYIQFLRDRPLFQQDASEK